MKTLWKGFFESPTHVLLPVGLSLSERCYDCSQKILHINRTTSLLLGELLYKSLDFQNPLKALKHSLCGPTTKSIAEIKACCVLITDNIPLQISYIVIIFLINNGIEGANRTR